MGNAAEHWGIDRGRDRRRKVGGVGGGLVAVVLRLVVWVAEQTGGLRGAAASNRCRVAGRRRPTPSRAVLVLTVHLW